LTRQIRMNCHSAFNQNTDSFNDDNKPMMEIIEWVNYHNTEDIEKNKTERLNYNPNDDLLLISYVSDYDKCEHHRIEDLKSDSCNNTKYSDDTVSTAVDVQSFTKTFCERLLSLVSKLECIPSYLKQKHCDMCECFNQKNLFEKRSIRNQKQQQQQKRQRQLHIDEKQRLNLEQHEQHDSLLEHNAIQVQTVDTYHSFGVHKFKECTFLPYSKTHGRRFSFSNVRTSSSDNKLEIELNDNFDHRLNQRSGKKKMNTCRQRKVYPLSIPQEQINDKVVRIWENVPPIAHTETSNEVEIELEHNDVKSSTTSSSSSSSSSMVAQQQQQQQQHQQHQRKVMNSENMVIRRRVVNNDDIHDPKNDLLTTFSTTSRRESQRSDRDPLLYIPPTFRHDGLSPLGYHEVIRPIRSMYRIDMLIDY
jgi:hypothetical protein